MVRIHNDGSLEDEELVREGGVFVSRNGGHEVDADEARAADDYIEDPGTGDGVPGTVDDLPYDFGLDIATAADQLLESSGRDRGSHSKTGRVGCWRRAVRGARRRERDRRRVALPLAGPSTPLTTKPC